MTSINTQRLLDKMMPIVGFFDNGRFVAVARCDTPGCGRETRWSSDSMPNPGTVFTKIRNRKWQASKKGITCDKCVSRKRQPPVREFKREPEPPLKPIASALRDAVERQVEQPPTVAETPITTELRERPLGTAEGEREVPQDQGVAAPSDKAKAAKREAYSLLLEHYDDQNKRYNGDWSDKKIAQLSGLSEAKVAALRDEDFGPAGPPPQMIDLKTRITSMETRLREREQQVLRAMDEIPQMQEEVSLLKSQLESLIKAHGWSA